MCALKACELIKELAQIVSEEGDCDVVLRINVEGQGDDNTIHIGGTFISDNRMEIILESEEIQIPF